MMCDLWVRHALAAMTGRIISIAAPVVPMMLAMIVPTASSMVFTAGPPLSLPRRRTPPATVNSANSNMIKGT